MSAWLCLYFFQLSAEVMHQSWIEVSRHRLGLAKQSSTDAEMLQSINLLMTSSNVIDRVHLLKTIIDEFPVNTALRQTLRAVKYVIYSPDLSWFEVSSQSINDGLRSFKPSNSCCVPNSKI